MLMKRIIFLCLMCIVTLGAMAQETKSVSEIDFSTLINSIDWSKTESDILKQYPNDIKQRKHFFSKHDNTMTDYEFGNVILSGVNCKASIRVDSISKKLHSLSFSFDGIEKKKDAKVLSKEMDNILFSLFGEPDKRKDDWSSKSMNDIDRTWYKDKYIVEVRHMVFTDMHFYSLVVKGVQDKGNDFRIAKWGDSKKAIMSKEGKEDISTVDRIYLFPDYVAGIKCDVAYIFTNDKLSMAKYMFNPTHTNKNDYIADYRKLVELMTEKYGKPKYDAPEWKNSLYKNDNEEYGFAISLGHLAYSAGWFGETTKITVALYGENHKITLMIQYVSEKYKDLKDKQDIQEKIKDL